MKLIILAAATIALAGCNRGQSASAQTLQRDGGVFSSPNMTPTFTLDAGIRPLTRIDAGTMQLQLPPTATPPGGTSPYPNPTGGGVIPR